MRVIAIINQKGGVAKTTTALALGAGLIKAGYSVLFIDFDGQGSMSLTIGVDSTTYSIMDVLTGRCEAVEAIQQTEQSDIIAFSPLLAGADITITGNEKEYRLKEALEPLCDKYDYAILDTAPALGITSINALTACTGCVIPVQPDIYSIYALNQLHGTIEAVKQYSNPALKVLGILLTRYNSRTAIGRDITLAMEDTAAMFYTKLYKAKIRESTQIKESQAVRKDIFSYAPKNSNAVRDYSEFIKEFLTDDHQLNLFE